MNERRLASTSTSSSRPGHAEPDCGHRVPVTACVIGILLLALQLPEVARAQGFCRTLVPGGSISSQVWTRSGSPYCIGGDITLSDVTIQAGVRVLIDGPHIIKVVSASRVDGTRQLPVVFTSLDTGVAWGGIEVDNVSPGPEFRGCVIRNADNSGLRIHESEMTIEQCVIEQNIAHNGGGLNITLDQEPYVVRISDSLIRDNRATQSATDCNGNGPGNGAGGGIYASVTAGQLELDAVRITGNVAGRSGVQGQRSGGGLYARGNVSINNSHVDHNTVHSFRCPCIPGGVTARARGAGIYADGTLLLANSIVEANRSNASSCSSGSGVASGSGVYLASGRLGLTNTVVAQNTASGNGPGNSTASRAAVYVSSGIADIANSTLTENSGIGLYGTTPDVAVVNSVVYFNDSGNTQILGDPLVTYSDVQGSFPGTGNLNVNPALGPRPDRPVLAGSPLIDSGDPAAQWNDGCFPPSSGGLRNDIGAHGGPGACAFLDSDSDTVPDVADNCVLTANSNQVDTNGDGFGQRCDADLDDDGLVFIPDLVEFFQSFISCSVLIRPELYNEHADFDSDGCILGSDLQILIPQILKAPGPSCCDL